MSDLQDPVFSRRRACAWMASLPWLPLAGCGGGGGASAGSGGEPPPASSGRVEVARFPVDGGFLVAAAANAGGDQLLLKGTSAPQPPGSSAAPGGDGSWQYWRCLGDARAGHVTALQGTNGIEPSMVSPQGQVHGLTAASLDERQARLYRWDAEGRREDLGAFVGSGIVGSGPRRVADDWLATDKSAMQLSTSQIWRMPDALMDDAVPTANWVRYWGDGYSSAPGAASRVFYLKGGRITCLCAGRPYSGQAPVRLYEVDLVSGSGTVAASDLSLNLGWPQTDGERAAWVSSAGFFPPGSRDQELFDLWVARVDAWAAARQVARGVGNFRLSEGTLAWQRGLSVARQGGVGNPTPSSIWVDDGSATGQKLAEDIDLVLAAAGSGAVVWTSGTSPTTTAAPGTWLWTRSGGVRKIGSVAAGQVVVLAGRLYLEEGRSGEARVIYRVDF